MPWSRIGCKRSTEREDEYNAATAVTSVFLLLHIQNFKVRNGHHHHISSFHHIVITSLIAKKEEMKFYAALLGTTATVASAWNNDTTALEACSYSATCTVRRVNGICVSKSSGCCTGTLSTGYCPGSNDIQCCTNAKCSTPHVSNSALVCYTVGETLFC